MPCYLLKVLPCWSSPPHNFYFYVLYEGLTRPVLVFIEDTVTNLWTESNSAGESNCNIDIFMLHLLGYIYLMLLVHVGLSTLHSLPHRLPIYLPKRKVGEETKCGRLR